MDLRQLDYFVHVAELGSFSKAASLLSIAQSALSTRVRQLEVELKQPLLHRNGRGVTPTDAGKRLNQIRLFIGINLVVGLVVIALGSGGRYFFR